MSSRRYRLHGLLIEVESDHSAVLSALDARLRPLSIEGDGKVDIRLHFLQAVSPDLHHVGRVPSDARPVYDPPTGTVGYVDATDELYIEYGDRIRARCLPGEGTALVSSLEEDTANPWLVSHAISTLLLIEMCKRRGLFSLHAAGMGDEGDAILFPGDSGSGKSTLTLALLARGWGFLGDDIVFLRTSPGIGVEVCAFPDEIDASDTTVKLISGLQGLPESPRSERGKRSFRPEAYFETNVIWGARPKALLFPRVRQAEHSELVQIGADESLLALAPNVLLTDAASAQSHLDVLAALASSCPAYRFDVGSDLDGAVDLVADMLSRSRSRTGT